MVVTHHGGQFELVADGLLLPDVGNLLLPWPVHPHDLGASVAAGILLGLLWYLVQARLLVGRSHGRLTLHLLLACVYLHLPVGNLLSLVGKLHWTSCEGAAVSLRGCCGARSVLLEHGAWIGLLWWRASCRWLLLLLLLVVLGISLGHRVSDLLAVLDVVVHVDARLQHWPGSRLVSLGRLLPLDHHAGVRPPVAYKQMVMTTEVRTVNSTQCTYC